MWNSYDLTLVDHLFLADAYVTYFSSEKEGLITGIEALRDTERYAKNPVYSQLLT